MNDEKTCNKNEINEESHDWLWFSISSDNKVL